MERVVRHAYCRTLADRQDEAETGRGPHFLSDSGDMQVPVAALIEQKYFKAFDNRDYRWTNELTVKTAFLTLLFNDTFYIMDSETALERGYADMTMIVRPDMRQFALLDFLIEFKCVPLGQNNLTGQQVKQMSEADLRALAPVQAALVNSESKLAGYRETLARGPMGISYGCGSTVW